MLCHKGTRTIDSIIGALDIFKSSGILDNLLNKVFEIAERRTEEDASYIFFSKDDLFDRAMTMGNLQRMADKNICNAAKKVILKQMNLDTGTILICCGYLVRYIIEICELKVNDLHFDEKGLESVKFERTLRAIDNAMVYHLFTVSAIERETWIDEFVKKIKDPLLEREFILNKMEKTDYCDKKIRKEIPDSWKKIAGIETEMRLEMKSEFLGKS